VWREFLEELKKQPGIIVTSTNDEAGKMIIEGLRDPLAEDPLNLLKQSQLDAVDVRFSFTPYISLENDLVKKRLLARLSPPSGLNIDFNKGHVTASGEIPVPWLIQSAQTLRNFPGIEQFNVSPETVLKKIQEIEAENILFSQGQADFDESQKEKLNKIVVLLNDLDLLADSFGDDFNLIITGYTDETGGTEINQVLSEMRADTIYKQLAEEGFRHLNMEKVAGGIKEVDTSESTASAKCVNLCVKWQPSQLWLKKEQE
jgi:OOP family OmpA-OmpF porin